MALVVPVKKRIVLYGPTKTGKSEGLATIPKGATLWIANVDRQLGAFAKKWNDLGHPEKNVAIKDIDTSHPDAGVTFAKIRDTLWNVPSGYDFYAVDNYTPVGLFITYKVVGKAEGRRYNEYNNTQLAACVVDFWMEWAAKIERFGAWSITIMHEKLRDMEGKEQEVAKSSAEKRSMQVLAPDVSSQAKVVIPGQCDFVWHVERAPGIVKRGGKSVSASVSVVRTRGTSVITASSTGKDHLLKMIEPLDIAHLLKKMGEDWKAKAPKIKKFTSKKSEPKTETKTKTERGKRGRFAK